MHDCQLDSPRGLGNHRQHDDSSVFREQRKENYNAWLVILPHFCAVNSVVVTCANCHAEKIFAV